MKGIELARGYFEEYGKPMLEAQFSDILPHIAVGFVGSGSERYGFDDETSLDHDYDVGFSIFLPDKSVIDERQEFLLERAYSKLPKEYRGIKRPTLSPVGGNRNGPVRTTDFYREKIGFDGGLTVRQWLTTPDYAFFEATNGEVFYDGDGVFTGIRQYLSDIPEDVRKKRLAGNLLIMAQSGQYNYMRCVRRGEREGAQLALHEFVSAATKSAFLLCGKFAPYYKWTFRALRTLPIDAALCDLLSSLLLADATDCRKRYEEIESVCAYVIDMLKAQGLTKAICGDLEKHAYSVNDGITDGTIRNYSLFVSVQ